MKWPEPLRTSRLTLCPWDTTDMPALFPACGAWEGAPSRILGAAYPDRYAVFVEGDDKAAAALALVAREGEPDEADLVSWVREPYRGDGYRAEALQALLRHAFLDCGYAAVWTAQSGSDPVRTGRTSWEAAQRADATDDDIRGIQQAEASRICAELPLISWIRSGGQTGADRGGLDAAREAGVPICGWCPPGGLAEDCPEPPGLLALYPELEEGMAPGYVERTAWNVRDAHATLIVSPGGLEPLSGTEMTEIFAERFGRPVLVVEGADPVSDAERAWEWLRGTGLRGIALNIAGPRESKMPGVHDATKAVVAALLAHERAI